MRIYINDNAMLKQIRFRYWINIGKLKLLFSFEKPDAWLIQYYTNNIHHIIIYSRCVTFVRDRRSILNNFSSDSLYSKRFKYFFPLFRKNTFVEKKITSPGKWITMEALLLLLIYRLVIIIFIENKFCNISRPAERVPLKR